MNKEQEQDARGPTPAAKQTKAAGQTTAKKTGTAMSLQEKFVRLREAVPAIVQRQHSEGVSYKFAKIYDVYQLLTPAMNTYGVNFDIVGEAATRHAENGDPAYFSSYMQRTRNGERVVWVYEADLTIRWTNADNPKDTLEVTLHAIGTNDSGPDKAKGSAWTYCLKYYLFEKFGIDQGDDDPDMADHSSEAAPQAAQRPAAPQNAPAGRNTQQQAQRPQNGQSGAQKPLTDAQLSRMYRKGEDAGITQQQIDAQIAQQYGKQDPHMMTRAQYDEICNRLDEARRQRQEQGGTANV